MRVHKTPTDLSNVFDTKIVQLISIFSLCTTVVFISMQHKVNACSGFLFLIS